MAGDAEPTLRLDKWLWHARFAKSRSVAVNLVTKTGVRVNGERAPKAASTVRPGDVLTFALGKAVKVVRVLEVGVRRGPASEAQTLYEDLSPPPPQSTRSELRSDPPSRKPGHGRPTKADRRALDRFTSGL